MPKILVTCIYTFIFLTGAAGLIYQVTWQKYLSRLLGSDSVATAIILATFLGGLSIGYYFCGKLTTRIKRHFIGYAFLEGIIGIWCLLFPLLFALVDALTKQWRFSPPVLIVGQGVFSSILLMGIPTICMGGTIPFLTRGISRSIGEATRVHARVYAVNTAGAFVGTLLAGFYMIPNFGLPRTMVVTAFLNLATFVFFMALPKIQGPDTGAGVPPVPVETDSSRISSTNTHRLSPGLLYTIALLSGLYVMTLENVLIRITNLSIGSSSYSFSIIVSVFILAIAAGSFVVGTLKQISKWLLYVNQLGIAFLLLAIFLTLERWPYWAHLIRISLQSNIGGLWGYYILVFLGLAAILVLPVGLMGATVPLIFHELKRELATVGKHSGLLLSWNTIGNLIGSLVGGIVLYYLFDIRGVFLTAVSLATVSAGLIGWPLTRKTLLPIAGLVLLIGIVGFTADYFNPKNFTTGTYRIRTPLPYSFNGYRQFFEKYHQGFDLKYYKDGPTATVAVTQDSHVFPFFDKQSMALFVNGKSDSSTIGDIYTLKLLAHIPALLADKRSNVMVVGLGTGVTTGELTLYPDIQRIDVAEISPSVAEAFPVFQEFTYGAQDDPRVNLIIGDAFRIIGRSDRKWDIVISEPSNPWVTGVDALFTREFYHLVKSHLTPNGVLMQWAHTIVASPDMIAMILNTIQQEFKHIHVFLAGSDLLIMAANAPIACSSLSQAETSFNTLEPVRRSLLEINVTSLASLLIKERWTTSYLADYFFDAGIQSLDYPRLHYMAGKDFFIGRNLPKEYFLNSQTTAYIDEYLFYKQCEDWSIGSDSQDDFRMLLESTRSKIEYEMLLPITKALLQRAYLSDPEKHPLSGELQAEFRDDLVAFIAKYPDTEQEWGIIGYEGAPIRVKAEVLLAHIEKFRNWMVPYPLDGIVTLLQKGMIEGRDAYEKNWCALQLALLLNKERVDPSYIKAIIDNTIKDENGKILLHQADQPLIKRLNKGVQGIGPIAATE
jgi:spermidine synthase